MDNTEQPFLIRQFKATDGYQWRYRVYQPATTARANLVGIHGVQSHGGWYQYSCKRLSDAGYSVSFLDRRGSGLNEQNRGDAPSFRRLLDDIAEYLMWLKAVHEIGPFHAKPTYLLAISWGGKLGAALQRRHPGLIDGLALLCPGFFPRVRLSFRQRLAIAFIRLVRPQKLFPIPLNEPELFTGSPPRQQFIREDLLGLREATARFFVESARLDGYLKFVAKYVKVPTLLMLAEYDRIIDNNQTRTYFEKFGSLQKQFIEYAKAHHTLEFEPEPDVFINDLLKWLDNIIPTSHDPGEVNEVGRLRNA